MLNSVEWGYFKLDDLFEIKRGNRLIKKDRIAGNVPFVTAGELNQGVATKISRNIKGAAYFKKRYLTLDMFGNAFARNYDFGADDNIYVLHNENLNHTNAFFAATVINQNKYRFGYGRQCRIKNINFDIKLPIKPKTSADEENEPDWEFMEEYMRKISKGNLDGFNLPKNDVRLSLDDREWDGFKLDNLFNIKASKNNNKSTIQRCVNNNGKNTIAYITRSTRNNGVNFFANSQMLNDTNIPIYDKNCIVVGIESSTAFYASHDFVTGTNITRLYHEKLNVFSGLFIINIINSDMFRYSYSRGLTLGRLRNTVIKLPIKPKPSPDKKSEPDWEFMENYIKGLPYTNKL